MWQQHQHQNEENNKFFSSSSLFLSLQVFAKIYFDFASNNCCWARHRRCYCRSMLKFQRVVKLKGFCTQQPQIKTISGEFVSGRTSIFIQFYMDTDMKRYDRYCVENLMSAFLHQLQIGLS